MDKGLRIDKTWDVIESFFKRTDHPFAFNQIESFNAFIVDICDILENFSGQKIESSDGQIYTISFGKYKFTTPTEEIKSSGFDSKNPIKRLLFPSECIQRGIPYEANLYVDVTITPGTTYKNFLLMTFPIMVGSNLCNLKNYIGDEISLAKLKEDIYDTLGYFIVLSIKDDGTRGGKPIQKRSVVFQERMTYNKFFFSTNKQKKVDRIKYPYSSNLEIRCSYEVSSMTITNMGITDDGRVRIDLPWMKDANSKTSITFPILIIIYALGYDNEFFLKKTLTSDKDLKYIEKCFEDSYGVESQEAAIEYIIKSKKGIKKEDEDDQRKYVMYALQETFLCHLNDAKSVENTFRRKAYYIIFMFRSKIDHIKGLIDDTIKDHFAYKRVLTTGTICSQHFYNSLKKTFGRMRKKLKTVNGGKTDVISHLDSVKLSNGWKKAFIRNAWEVTLSKVDGICQLSDTRNQMSKIADLNKMYLGIGGKEGTAVKVTEPRDYHPSQAMKIDPMDTPEGGKVGLSKTTAIGTYITSYKDPTFLYEIIFSLKDDQGVPLVKNFDNVKDDDRPEIMIKIICNGVWMGCSIERDIVVKKLRDMRRRANLDFDVTIFSERDTVVILTDQGRMIRPVFIVENGKIKYTKEHREKLKNNRLSFYNLVQQGIVEYIGDLEEDSSDTYIAVNIDSINEKHSHCEIHETFMAGFGTNDNPFFNRNPAARECYEDSMKKQAIGIPGSNYRFSYENNTMVINYPQKPLASTRYTKLLELDKTPGEQCYMTLICAGQYNEEDSIELNRSSIQRGLAVANILKVYCTEYQEDCFLGIPNREMCDLGEENPRFLDEDGIVKVGSKVYRNDILLGLLKKNVVYEREKEKKNTNSFIKEYINECVVYDSDLPGIVDSCQVCDSPTGGRYIRVCVMQTRIPEVGDKFSAKHGQKGTCGMLHNQEDMPFNNNGICPDIIINAAAFPSRMTTAMLVEMLSGKAVLATSKLHDVKVSKILEGIRKKNKQKERFSRLLLDDGRVDATAFIEEATIQEFSNELKSKGFDSYGDEQFYDGKTGEPLACLCFFGPVSWHRMHHLSMEKNHARSTGQTTTLFRQPVEGRSQGGGGRLGVQERDCLIANSTPGVLKDGYYYRSDPFNITVCSKCGIMMDSEICNLCK